MQHRPSSRAVIGYLASQAIVALVVLAALDSDVDHRRQLDAAYNQAVEAEGAANDAPGRLALVDDPACGCNDLGQP